MVQNGAKLASNRAAVEVALEALAVGPHHAALVESVRSLADVVDRPGFFDDKAWREYRLALRNLMEATGDGGSDAFNEYLKGLSAKVGDGEDSG